MKFSFFNRAAAKKEAKTEPLAVSEQIEASSFIDDAEKAADIVTSCINSGEYSRINDELSQLVFSEAAEEPYVFPPHAIEQSIASYIASWLLIAGALFFALQGINVIRYSSEYRIDGVLFLLLSLIIFAANLLRRTHRKEDQKYYRRYEIYANILKYRKIEIVSDLARVADVNSSLATKDLKRAVKERLIPEGHFGRNNFIFLTSDELYADYLNRPAVYDRYFQKQLDERERIRNRSPELVDILSSGEESVQKIRDCNDQIKDAGITEKLNRLEMLVAAIFHEVEINPKQAKKLGLFMSYYLPTTEKLLDAYIDLDRKGEKGAVVAKTQKSIVDSMDMINNAFERLLEKFFQERYLELSSEITVMETLIKDEGLQRSR